MFTQIEKIGEPNIVQMLKKSLIEQNNGFLSITDGSHKSLNIPFDWIEIQEEKTSNPDYVKRKYTLHPMRLSEFIKKHTSYIFVKSADAETPLIYVYSNGRYVLKGENDFKGFIKVFIPSDLRNSKQINEIFFDIKTENKYFSFEELNKDENIINFQDGILHLDDMKLYPHDPKILSTIQIPAKYEDVLNAPDEPEKFNEFLLNFVDNDSQSYLLIMETIGLVISNVAGFKTKKSLFLVGEGNTGKSQLKKLAEYLVGEGNYCNTELKNLTERFGTSDIYGKRLVGSNDMNYQKISDMSILKQLTGGDAVRVEFKNRSAFSYIFKGFLWFNCNRLPLFGGDIGSWVYDRIIPVKCPNVIPLNKRDPNLINKLIAEKNSILKIALKALKQLINDNYKFAEPSNAKNVREMYEQENNTLLTFINECCVIIDTDDPRLRAKRKDFYKAYDYWIKMYNNGKGKLTSKDIMQTLENKFGKNYLIKSSGEVYIKKIAIQTEFREECNLNW